MTTTQEEIKETQVVPEGQNLSAEEVLLLQDMAEAGLLYGLMKGKTHPGMKPWIFATRSGVEIINLENTVKELAKAEEVLKKITASGKSVLIVGTSSAAKMAAKEFATEAGQPFVAERWLGGTLTNFKVIEGRIKYYNKLIADKESGALNKYTKKERILLDKKMEKMRLLFEGLSGMTGLPGAVFILDIRENKLAAREARGVGIPVIAVVNTDTDPKSVDYPIPANNRLSEGIRWILDHLKGSLKKAPAVPAEVKEQKGL
jgi:small subunit ribosomal protein S2